jgi:hypothetical protein
MRWMDGWSGEGFKELGCGQLENKGSSGGWLEKAFRAGQDPQRVVVPIIIIIIIIIIAFMTISIMSIADFLEIGLGRIRS